jgi:prepilin-type N-terminal cleavage/methylation domain-containing protein
MRNEDQSKYVARRMRKRSEGGFTLIELLIVIIILAILAAIVVFAVGTTGKNASAASCKSDAKTVETALETYKAELATYPAANAYASLTGSTVVAGKGTFGPFMRSAPGTVHYEINFSASGQVSADPTGTIVYTPADDVDTGAGGITSICNTSSS